MAAIARHAAVREAVASGEPRLDAGGNLDERALAAAVAAAVRHTHTGYDRLLAAGLDRGLARQRIAGQVEEILTVWRK